MMDSALHAQEIVVQVYKIVVQVYKIVVQVYKIHVVSTCCASMHSELHDTCTQQTQDVDTVLVH